MEVNDWIAAAQKGEQQAFTALMNRYWSEVYFYMLKRTENETDAEDLTLEAFGKAFDKIQTYKPEFQFNTWLISIAKNAHIDLLRKRRTEPGLDRQPENWQQLDPADNSPTAEDQLITEQNLKSLLDCIRQLPPNYQSAIQLRYFQELSYQEMAEQLDESLSTVKVRLLRAKKLLANIIRQRKGE